MFNNSKSIRVSGGTYNVSTSGTKVTDLLLEAIAPGAFHNSAERYDPPKCHPRTRLAVLEAIMAWIEDGQKTSFIKWLYGPAGAGKSAITQTIAETCYRLGILAASFFWSRNAPGRNTEKQVIVSLAYQLMLSIPKMRIYVEQALEDDLSLLSRSLDAQMDFLIVEPLEKAFPRGELGGSVNSSTPKVIILDGLDECGTPEAQRYILKVISAAVPRFSIPLVFLIASRPEQEIRAGFNTTPLVSMTVRLALDDTYHPDDDIRLFLVESFVSLKETHALGSLLPSSWPTAQEVDRLVRKSSGQFIYATTVMKFVRSPGRRPDEQLNIILGIADPRNDTPFADLDALYLHIFTSVDDISRALEIISCIFFLNPSSYRDTFLSAYDIENILSYNRGDLYLILIDLHSILEVLDIRDPAGEVRIFHASLEDFLLDPARSRNCYLDEGRARARIARGCLQYIRHYSEFNDNDFEFDAFVFGNLFEHCSQCSPTKELLADLFDFDFGRWSSALLNIFEGIWFPNAYYKIVYRLYRWFQTQESRVRECFGPGMSLSAHHARSWRITRDLLFEKVVRSNFKLKHQNVVAAATHPQLVRNRDTHYEAIEMVLAGDISFLRFPFHDQVDELEQVYSADEAAENMLELQKFLRDPDRAKSLFVHGRTYAALCLHILKFIPDHWEPERSIWFSSMGRDVERRAVLWATESLPFYLANADYTPELIDYLRSDDKCSLLKHCELVYCKLQPLHEEIDRYLKGASEGRSLTRLMKHKTHQTRGHPYSRSMTSKEHKIQEHHDSV